MKTYDAFKRKRSKRQKVYEHQVPKLGSLVSWEDADTVYLGRRASAWTLAPLGRRGAAMTASCPTCPFRLPCQPPSRHAERDVPFPLRWPLGMMKDTNHQRLYKTASA